MPNSSLPLISVIVPVYRGRELFASLLAGLRNQTLRNIEIILVDDCGDDGTFDIALAAAGEDPRIRCLHNETNRGPGPSRNRGIEAARGEYIGFADADDIIPPDYYRLLYDKARQTDALVVKGRRAARHADGSITCSNTNDGIREGLARAETMLNLFTFEHTTGIYRNSLVQETGARNADARQDEDTAFLCMLMGSVPPARFALQEDAVYYYRKVETSLTHHLSASYFEESVKSMQFKLAHLMNLPDSEEVARYAANLFEERCSWRLSRMPEAPDMTDEQKEAYCAAVRTCVNTFVSRGRTLRRPGAGTALVACGLPAQRVLSLLPRGPLPASAPAFFSAVCSRAARAGRGTCRALLFKQAAYSLAVYSGHRVLAFFSKRHASASSRHRSMLRLLMGMLAA